MANNVTIRNFKVSSSGSYWGINTYGTNTVIEDGEVDGGSTTDDGVKGVNYTIRRCHIHHMGGDAFKADNNVRIEACYIHDVGQASGAHGDGVQMMGGTGITIIGNNFNLVTGSLNACIFPGGGGSVTNLTVQNNRLNGGGWVVYCSNGINMQVLNNVFGPNYSYGAREGTASVWSGNTWESTGLPCQ